VFNDTSSFTISNTNSQSDGEDFSVSLVGIGFDPNDPGATTPTFDHELTGTAKVKGAGFKASEPYTLKLSFDTTALTFLAMDADGTLYSGNLAPKGTKGDKFRLFLDGASADALAADVAARSGIAAGGAAGAVLGHSSKLILKLLEDGSVALKVKSEVLTSGLGEVVFKANLTSAPQ
jgi:hypothetical protein